MQASQHPLPFARRPSIRKTSLLAGSAAVFAAVFVALSALGGAAARAQAPEKITVKLDFTPWGIHAGLQLAKNKGWFAKEGLDVTVEDGTGTLPGIQLVGAGKTEVAAVQLGPMAVARENGLPVISIAGYARRSDLAIMVDANTGAKNVKELAGKKIVSFTGSPWVPFIKPFTRAASLSDEQFAVTMVAPPAMVSTYASGNADAFLSLAPFGVPLVAKSRPARALLALDYGVVFPSYGLVTNEETLAKRPAVLRKLVQINTRAWEYIYQNAANTEEGVKAIIAERPQAKLDPDLLRGQIVAYREFFDTPNTKGKRFGWQSDADWIAAIKSMEGAGVIKPGRKPTDYYTNQFVD